MTYGNDFADQNDTPTSTAVTVMLTLEISIRIAAITNGYNRHGFNEKSTVAGKSEDILTSGMHSLQWPSMMVWISRPPVTTVLITRLSRQASAKLHRTASLDLDVDLLH